MVPSTCQIRVGGGWQELKEYVNKHGGITKADEDHPARLQLAGSALNAEKMEKGEFEAKTEGRSKRSSTDHFVDSILANWGNEDMVGRLCQGVGLNSQRRLKVGARVIFKLDMYCTDCHRQRGQAGVYGNFDVILDHLSRNPQL